MRKFVVERLRDGSLLVRLYDDTGACILKSTAIKTDVLAETVIDWVKTTVNNDWQYQINQEREGGPYFSITMRTTGIVFTSPDYSSCDAMESAITALKEIVCVAETTFVGAWEVSPTRRNGRRVMAREY